MSISRCYALLTALTLASGCATAATTTPPPPMAAAPPTATPPAKPVLLPWPKDVVVTTMGRVKGKVAMCYERIREKGIVRLALVVAPTGEVLSSTITFNDRADTPTGNCVAVEVAKTIRFPAFEGEPATLVYPIMLR